MVMSGLNKPTVLLKCPACRSVQRMDFLRVSISTGGVTLFCPFDGAWIDRYAWTEVEDQENWDNDKTPPMKPEDDRFPHRCPKCRGRCYIGLNTLDHEGGWGDECPKF